MPRTSQPLLAISKLAVQAGGKSVLTNLSLEVKPGEVHALMGPNGAGKSTLVRALLGHPDVVVQRGTVRFQGKNLLVRATHERAADGLFVAFQHPIAIPGVTIGAMLRTAVNAQRAQRGDPPLSAIEILAQAEQHLAALRLDRGFLDRELHVGLSGGEQKKAEVLQLLMLQPVLAILDETDSGLDVDALRIVAGGVQSFRCARNGVLVITHYPRLLKYLAPDRVHVLLGGKIVASGGPELATTIEERGYGWLGGTTE